MVHGSKVAVNLQFIDYLGRVSASESATSTGLLLHHAEVVDVLGLVGQLNRRTLSRLAEVTLLSNESLRNRPHAWARFSPADVARIVVALGLAGERDALAEGRRLKRLAPIQEACRALTMPPYSFRDPLLDVPLVRLSNRVLVLLDDDLFDPVSGQREFRFSISVRDRSLDRRIVGAANVQELRTAVAKALETCG